MLRGSLVEFEELDDVGLATSLKHFEMLRREAEASLAAIVDIAARRGVFRADGHRSARGWVKALTNCSDFEAANLVRVGRLVHSIPECGEKLFVGDVGVAQTRELARLHANPRCCDQLADSVSLLLGHAVDLPFKDFRECAKRWESLADPDGAHKDHKAQVEARTASVFEGENGLDLRGSGGSAAAAAEMVEIFEQFRQAEMLNDWDAAKAMHGERANASHMPRTDGQRRFDALLAIFRAAATAPVDARVTPATVNFVVDQRTFEEFVARTADSESSPGGRSWQSAGETDPRWRRCETESGTLVSPEEIWAAMLVGHVRRVVYDSAGNVIDVGRRRRLFTGTGKEAVLLQSPRCVWPGCDIRASRCEADHLKPWADDGETAPINGGPTCNHHNRFKNNGFTTRRDAEGHWHTYRPDGTSLTEPGGTNIPPGAAFLRSVDEHHRQAFASATVGQPGEFSPYR